MQGYEFFDSYFCSLDSPVICVEWVDLQFVQMHPSSKDQFGLEKPKEHDPGFSLLSLWCYNWKGWWRIDFWGSRCRFPLKKTIAHLQFASWRWCRQDELVFLWYMECANPRCLDVDGVSVKHKIQPQGEIITKLNRQKVIGAGMFGCRVWRCCVLLGTVFWEPVGFTFN